MRAMHILSLQIYAFQILTKKIENLLKIVKFETPYRSTYYNKSKHPYLSDIILMHTIIVSVPGHGP